jgi:hypothetical protein
MNLQRTGEDCKDHIHDLGSCVPLLQNQLGAIPNPQRVAAEEEHHDRAHPEPRGEALPDAGLVRTLQGLVVLLHRPFLAGERRNLQQRSSVMVTSRSLMYGGLDSFLFRAQCSPF